MGLIRKTLAVSTLGVVHGSSKKQRVAKATEKNTAAAATAQQQQAALAAIAVRQQATIAAAAAQQQAAMDGAAARQQTAMDAAALRIAEQKAEEEREFRYATDPVYRKFIDDKRAAAEAERAAGEAQRVAQIEAARVAEEAERAAVEARRVAQIEAARVAEEAERVAQIEAVRAADAARKEAARLRRLRNQQRAANVKKAFVLIGRGVAILVVGVFVWVPQLAVGRIRHRSVHKWMYPQLVRRPEPIRGQLEAPR